LEKTNMQTLTVLSDAELDAVSGGNYHPPSINIPIIRSFGSGGTGGTIIVGTGGNANGNVSVSVAGSSFSANGGNGTFTVS